MAILNILKYPDDRLYKIAKPIERISDNVRQLAADMAETMYAAPGVGLAATQVDRHVQMIVLDVSPTHDQLITLINPQITGQQGLAVREEGCLSLPGIYEEVERPERVTVRALDITGHRFELRAEGLLSVCVQHEMDHLRGRVFVQYLSRLKQNRIRTKLQKQYRQSA
jgi:peptide deformylase